MSYELNHVTISDDSSKPIDECLDIAARELEIEIILTGGSGFGWSRSSTLQQCAYKYKLKYIDEIEPPPPATESSLKGKGRDVGSAVHAFLACYYQRIIDIDHGKPNPTVEPGTLCDRLLELNASAIVVNEGWRLFEAYANFYETVGDSIRPLAVEYRVADPKEPRTCRYDLVAEVLPGGNVLPGIWLFNHKAMARMTRDLTEGYHLDGQIIDEIALYTRAGLHRRFGPLQGACLNLIIKTAAPTFHREFVAPPTFQLRRQAKDLRVHRALLGVYEATNTWPRSLSSCMGRYGFCDYWERCREGK